MKNITNCTIHTYDTRTLWRCLNVRVYVSFWWCFRKRLIRFPFCSHSACHHERSGEESLHEGKRVYMVKIFLGIVAPVFTTGCALCHLAFAAIPSFKCSSSSGARGSVVSTGKMIMSLSQSCRLKHLSPSPPPAWCLQPLFAALSSRKRGKDEVTMGFSVVFGWEQSSIVFCSSMSVSSLEADLQETIKQTSPHTTTVYFNKGL